MHKGSNAIYPIIVIGAGAGGLVVAIGAAKGGKKVLLIEKGNYGGDCTNFGCIPSKSFIAASHAAHYMNSGSGFGIKGRVLDFETRGTLVRTRRIVEEIRKHENPEALAELGIDSLTGSASFKDPHTLQVQLENGDLTTVSGKHIVIATGSYPHIPNIDGLENCAYLTNETIFNLKHIPGHLGVIGGGPIGSELAQAFGRLGSQVTIIQHDPHLLKKEEPDAQKVIEDVFTHEGLILRTNCEPRTVSQFGDNIRIIVKNKETQSEETIEVDHLLISTGRRPRIENLNLDAINVKTSKEGILVDAYGRTTHKHIWAVGDVTGRALFTHAAENEARTVLKNLLLPWPFRFKLDRSQAMPRVTYTDPEIASAGLSEKEAISLYGTGKIAVYKVPFSELDRAITTGRTEGFVKIITKKWSSKILGAAIVAPRAGEMLTQITTAMMAGLPLRKLSSLIHPYPTYSLAIRKAADQWLTKTILPAIYKLMGK